MKKMLTIGLLFLLVLPLVACGPIGAPQPVPRPAEVEVVRGMPVTVVVEKEVVVERPVAARAPAEFAGAPQVGDEELAEERKIIRTANMRLEVLDTLESMASAKEIVEGLDGYVVESSTWWQKRGPRPEDEKPWGRMVVRVPEEKFDQALEDIEALATKVMEEKTSGEDVTEEYVDLEARLTNMKKYEEEVRQLLTDVRERTVKVGDLVEVYRELNRIRGEIERIEGRMKYLSRLAAMSTITIDFQPKEERPILEAGWQPLQTVRDATRSLVNFFKGLVDVGIYLAIWGVALGGMLAIVVIIIWLIVRAILRARRRGAGRA